MRVYQSILLAAWVALGAHAAEGRIPVGNLAPPGAQIIIDQPGAYILTQNLSFPSQGSSILIQSDDVQLDLNGMQMTAPGSGAGIFISNDRQNVSIFNGHLNGGIDGNNLKTGIRIRNLRFSNRGISLSNVDEVEIVGCRFVATTGQAIDIQNAGGATTSFLARVEDNAIEVPQGLGIQLDGIDGGHVLGNRIHGTGSDGGISIVGDQTLIQGNSVSSVGASGISAQGTGNQIRNNMIDRATIGLTLNGPGSIVVGNTVTNSLSAPATLITSHSRIVGNVFRVGEGEVTLFGAGNLFKDNKISRINVNTGFQVGGNGNILESNVVSEVIGDMNPAVKIEGNFNLLAGNQIFGNDGIGIEFGGTAMDNVCRNNLAFSNNLGVRTGPTQRDGGGDVPSSLCN